MTVRTTRLALVLGFGFIPLSLFAAPPEVPSLSLSSPAQLSWDAVAGVAGYHVYRGSLTGLATGDRGACLIGSVPSNGAGVPANPQPGQGYFFLVGAFDESGSGPIGFSSSGVQSFPSVPCKPSRRNFPFIVEPSSDGLTNAEPPRSPSQQSEPAPYGMTLVNLHSGEVVVDEAGYDTAFFKSVSGLKTESEVTDYQEGGVTAFTRKIVGASSPADRFGGKYLVASCAHKYYHSGLTYDGPFGQGWESKANDRLRNAGPKVGWFSGQGQAFLFDRISAVMWEGPELYARLFLEPDGSFVLRFPDGYLRRYHGFDGSNLEGALTANEEPDGSRMSYLYDHQGLLTTIVDQLGRSHTLEYDAAGRIVREVDFDGRETMTTYDAAGNRVAVRSPLVTGTPHGNDFPAGKTTRYAYSSGFPNPALNHNLISIRTPAQGSAGLPVTRFEYGTDPTKPSFDRVMTRIDGDPLAQPPVGGTMTYAYQNLNAGADPGNPAIERRLTIVTDRNGNVEERIHNADGHPLSILRRTNRELRPGEPDYLTRHLYNANGQLLETTFPEGNRHVFVWDSAADLPQQNNLVQVRLVADTDRGDGHGGAAADIVWSFTYEPVLNQPLSLQTPRGHLVLLGYDYQEGDPATNGLNTLAARYQIDLGGIPLNQGDINADGRVDQARGKTIRLRIADVQLDPASQQAAIEGDTIQESQTTWAYDDHGRLIATVDPERNRHTISYHPETDPDGDGTPTPPPADGRTLSPSEGGYPHRLLWDTAADIGRNNKTNPPPVSARAELMYDRRGNVVRLIDPRGVAFEWTLNQLDQVVEARRATATFPATGYGEQGLTPLGFRTRYAYDADDNLVLLQREDVGETRGAGPWVDHSFVYDLLDNLTRGIRETTTGLDVEYRYAYDANGNPTGETTPEDVTHTLAWDERDLPLTSAAGASGPRGGTAVVRQFAYDGNGNLTNVVDGRGGLLDRAYDGFDRRVRAVDQAGNTSEAFHDASGNIVRLLHRGPVGGPTPPDRTGSTNVDLLDTRYTYDEVERLTRASTRLFVPDGSAPVRPPVLLEGPLVPRDGEINHWIEYDKLSRPTFDHTDTGAVSRYDYDGMGRLLRTTAPDGSTDDAAWDPAGNLMESVETELPSAPGPPFERFFTTHHYDAGGRLVLSFDNVGQAARRVYDSLDGLVATSDPKGPIQVTMPRRSALGAGLFVPINGHGNVTRYTYDGLDRLLGRVQVLSAGGQGDGSLTPPPVPTPANPTGTISAAWSWGPDSLLSAASDGGGHTTSYTYDNIGRLAQEQADDGTLTVYSYDGEGNLQQWIGADGGIVHQVHDLAQRPIEVSVYNPAGEGTTQQTYEYDGLSRLTRATDDNQPVDPNDDTSTTFLYDSLGRQLEEISQSGLGAAGISSMQWLGEDLPIGLVYPSGHTVAYSYDAAGRLTAVTGPPPAGGSSSFQYFGMSRVHTQLLGNGARTTVLNDAGTADIGFDGARRVSQLRHLDSNNAMMAAFEYRYDRGSNRTSHRRPHHPGPAGSQAAMGERYQYDSADRLIHFEERLLTIDHQPFAPPVDSQSWSLDAAGNWASFTRRGVAYLNTPNNNNEYDEPQSGGTRVDDGVANDFGDVASTPVADGVNMAHDIKGSRLADGVRYVYDGLDRLIRTETMGGAAMATYSYDALGRRTGRYVLSAGIPIRFSRYWGGQEIEEADQFFAPIHEFVHAGEWAASGWSGGEGRGGVWSGSAADAANNKLGSAMDFASQRPGGWGDWDLVMGAGGGPRYLLRDALGSTVALADGAAPVLLERVTYDPYGKPTFESAANVPLTDAAGSPIAQSPGGNPRLFAGMRYDPETGSRSASPAADRGGLYQTSHRMLNPNDGRFITRDPLGAWGDPSSGGNAYAYAGSNPINATDTTGLTMFNPKEITIDKPVPWQVHYNPKEVGLDKSVPWQKAKSSRYNVLFNPKEYTITKATPWKHHDIQGLDAPSQEFSQPYNNHNELFFDMYEGASIQMKRAAYCGANGLALQEATQMEVSSGHATGASIQMKRAAYCGTGQAAGTFSGPPRIFILLPTSGPAFHPPGMGGASFPSGSIPYVNSVPSISLFNWSLQNIPLIGSISVGFTIVPPAAPSVSGDVVVEYQSQRSNPFPFTKN